MKGKSVAKHVYRQPISGDLNNSSVFGLFLYLSGHTCPDIAVADYCSERYILYLKLLHKHALNRVGCYLKANLDKGLIAKSYEKLLKIDTSLDVDFLGMFGHEIICQKQNTELDM